MFRLIRIALDEVTLDEKLVIQTDITPESAAHDVSLLLVDAPFALPDWIKTTALYCLRFLETDTALPVIVKQLKSKNPLVLEAAIWAYCKLEKDEEEKHRMLW